MSNSWIPSRGRHSVTVGSSLSRALKARQLKGEAPAQRSLHARDFYSFRYNFKPPSIDPGKRGKIVVKKGKDATSVTVERPSTQPGEAHVFVGGEYPTKEWECVLIYDDVSDTYTLEKLDSHMALTYERKIALERTASPAAPAPPAEAPDLKYEQELERNLGAEEDADGEADEDFEEVLPQSVARREEEEEEEEIFIPPPPPKPARATKPPAPPPSLPPSTIPSKPTKPPPPAKPKPAAPSRNKKQKREPEPVAQNYPLSDADEELEFGKPAKRARPTPPSEGLALPGVSTPVYTPPPPVTQAAPPPPVSVSAPAPAPVSESEEEWDEVAAVGKDVETEDDFDIFGDAAAASVGGEAEAEGEDLDVNEFERELNLQMDEASDDDFLAAVVEEVPPSRGGGPISLNEFAARTYGSDDDYSSSEESDED